MSVVTDYGEGKIVDSREVRGTKSFLVEGAGFKVWQTELELSKYSNKLTADAGEDNSVALPYNPDPQFSAFAFPDEGGTIQPVHHVDPDERLHPADSVTFDSETDSEAGPEPGPNPDQFAKSKVSSNPRDRAGDSWRDSRDRGYAEHEQQDLDWDPSDEYDLETRRDIYSSNETPYDVLRRKAYIIESDLDPRVGALMDLVESDPQIREAAWADVRKKALRLRREGRVHVKTVNPESIYASVDGDHGTYDTIIIRGNVFDMGGQSVTEWSCACFLPGTKVTMGDGSLKEIEKIQPGDLVRTGSGKASKVLNTQERFYSDQIYGIRLAGNHEVETIWATKEHPWYSISDVRCEKCAKQEWCPNRCTHKQRKGTYVKTEELTTGHYLHLPVPEYEEKSVVFDLTEYMEGFEELEGGFVQPLSFVAQGQSQTYTRLGKTFTRTARPSYWSKLGNKAIQREVKLDWDVAYLLGMFTGDGSFGDPGEMCYTFGPDQKHFAEEVVRIYEDKFGVSGSIWNRNNTWNVRVCSKPIRELFHHLVGEHSRRKKLSEELVHAPLEVLEGFVRGYVDSDGHIRGNYWSISSVNRTLVGQTQDILHRLGYLTTLEASSAESQASWPWSPVGRVLPCYSLTWNPKRVKQNSTRFVEDGQIWVRVNGDIQSKHYEGVVYNLEVEGEHTYVVNGIHVHNCDWGKWAFKRRVSYVGRFCSHAYASYLELQSNANKGRSQWKRKKANPALLLPLLAEGGGAAAGGAAAAGGGAAAAGGGAAAGLGSGLLRSAPMLMGIGGGGGDEQQEDPPQDLGESEEDWYQSLYGFKRQGDELRTKPNRLVPDFIFNDTEDDHYFTNVEEDDRVTTGPEQITIEHLSNISDSDGSRRRPRREGFGYDSLGDEDTHTEDEYKQNYPWREEAPSWVRDHHGARDRWKEFSDYAQGLNPESVKNPGPGRWEIDLPDEDFDTLADDPGFDPENNWNDHPEEYQGQLDQLNRLNPPRGHQGSVYPYPQSHDEPFEGSGPAHKEYWSSSEDYVKTHLAPRMQDVADGEGPITKYTDGTPQQFKESAIDRLLRDASVENDLMKAEGDEIATIGEYSNFADDAAKEGRSDAASRFREVINDEKQHQRDFTKLQRFFTAGQTGMKKVAGKQYSLAQQEELINERHQLGARNLDELDLEGTHYLDL